MAIAVTYIGLQGFHALPVQGGDLAEFGSDNRSLTAREGCSGKARGRARKRAGAQVEEVLPQISSAPGLHLIPYRATLDVSAELVRYLAQLLAAERRRRGTRPGVGSFRAVTRRSSPSA